MKKFLCIILSLFMLTLIGCGNNGEAESKDASAEIPAVDSSVEESSESPAVTRPESISVVLLGDSIARGATLTDPESQRYSTLLAKKLKADYSKVEMKNLGLDGQTGAELLESIKTDPDPALSDCDYIFVSIGGNNILQFLTTLEGAEEFTSAISPETFTAYFAYIIAETEEQKQKLAYSCEVISNAFETLNSTYASEQFGNLIEQAAEKLKTEIPNIVTELKKINPDAEIIVQTVYNPFKDMIITLTDVTAILDMHVNGEAAVGKLNEQIKANAAEYGYTVLDVHKGFAESIKTLTFAGLDITKASFSLDPHPNEKGHELIAELYYNYLTEKYNG